MWGDTSLQFHLLSDMENLLMYLLDIFCSLEKWLLRSSLLSNWIGYGIFSIFFFFLFLAFCYWVVWVCVCVCVCVCVYIQGINPLSHICFANIFSHYIDGRFFLLMVSFTVQSFLAWYSPIYLFLLLLSFLLVSNTKSHQQNWCQGNSCLMFS